MTLLHAAEQNGVATRASRIEEEVFTPTEAAAYLGLTAQEFGAICRQYGIGRRHVSRDFDQIVYYKGDLTNPRNVLERRVVVQRKGLASDQKE